MARSTLTNMTGLVSVKLARLPIANTTSNLLRQHITDVDRSRLQQRLMRERDVLEMDSVSCMS